MKQPRWTRTPPKGPGLYWYRLITGRAVHHCQVRRINGVLVVSTGEDFIPVTQPLRWWAGPLPEPPR
jgi:hypothetical protein